MADITNEEILSFLEEAFSKPRNTIQLLTGSDQRFKQYDSVSEETIRIYNEEIKRRFKENNKNI